MIAPQINRIVTFKLELDRRKKADMRQHKLIITMPNYLFQHILSEVKHAERH